MSERWLPVVGYEGHYEVSDLGHVRSLDRMVRTRGELVAPRKGRLLKRMVDLKGSGYAFVNLSRGGEVRKRNVHALVLEAFLGPRGGDGYQACHRDGDRTNPVLTNLRWDTVAANAADRVAHGTQVRGERSTGAKLREADVLAIRTSQKTSIALGKELGVASSTVRAARSGDNWGYL